MRHWRVSLVSLLIFGVFVLPLSADVVPPRKAGVDPEAERILHVLASAGTPSDSAVSSLQCLTASELEYFASDPQRVQVAGAQQDFMSGQSINLWYESVGGAVFLAAGVGFGYYWLHLRE